MLERDNTTTNNSPVGCESMLYCRRHGSGGALFALLLMIAVFICSQSAFAAQHVFIAFVSNTAGLSDSDRAFTLAADTVASFAMDSFSGIGMLPDADVKMVVGKEETAALWNGDGHESKSLMDRLNADAIIIARHSISGGKTRSEIRILRVADYGKIKSDKITVENKSGGIYATRNVIIAEVFKKMGIQAGPAALGKLWTEKEGKSTALFAEGLKKLDDNRVDQGLAALESALKGSPNFRDLNCFLGIYYAGTQYNYEMAIKKLASVKEKYPGDAAARFQLGFVYGSKGEYDRAAEEYAAAARLKPGYYEAHISLAMLKNDSGDYAAAAAHYRKALEIRPSAALVWYSLACCLALSGKSDEAIVALKKAVEIAPDTFAKSARKDNDLSSLRKNPEFKKLLSGSGE